MLKSIFQIAATLMLMATGVAQADATPLAVAHSGNLGAATGICTAGNFQDAAECARRKCLQSGGTETGCLHIRSCGRAGWSFALTMTRTNGYVWADFHCGFTSRASALKVRDVICAIRAVDAACATDRLLDPTGKDVPVQ